MVCVDKGCFGRSLAVVISASVVGVAEGSIVSSPSVAFTCDVVRFLADVVII